MSNETLINILVCCFQELEENGESLDNPDAAAYILYNVAKRAHLDDAQYVSDAILGSTHTNPRALLLNFAEVVKTTSFMQPGLVSKVKEIVEDALYIRNSFKRIAWSA